MKLWKSARPNSDKSAKLTKSTSGSSKVRGKWKAPLAYTTIGALIGSAIISTAPAFADANSGFKVYWGQVFQNGQFFEKSPAIQHDGTNFFGLWYLNQLLQKDGIQVKWDGKTLQLNNVPVQQATTLTVANPDGSATSASPVVANSIVVNGVTYVPLSTVETLLTKLGSRFHIEDGSGHGQGDSKDAVSSSGLLQSAAINLHNAIANLSTFGVVGAGGSDGNGPKHSDGGNKGRFGGPGGVSGMFTSAMAQIASADTKVTTLENAFATLNQSAPGTTSGTSATSTGTSTVTGTVYGSNPGVLATSLQQVSTSLQADLASLNAIALTTYEQNAGITSGSSATMTSTVTSSTSLASVISDLTTQEQTLAGIQTSLGAGAVQFNGLKTSSNGGDN